MFHVVAVDLEGAVIQRAKFARDPLQSFFDLAPKALIGMEACPGSQWLARKLIGTGHDARIIPARFVKTYVKSNKTDTIDAAAIAEAVTGPTMRFVEARTAEQVDLQAHHRIRDRLVGERTGLMNQARAFCIEYGLAMRVGAGGFHADIRRHLGNLENDLTQTMRDLVNDLLDDLAYNENRVKALSRWRDREADRYVLTASRTLLGKDCCWRCQCRRDRSGNSTRRLDRRDHASTCESCRRCPTASSAVPLGNIGNPKVRCRPRRPFALPAMVLLGAERMRCSS